MSSDYGTTIASELSLRSLHAWFIRNLLLCSAPLRHEFMVYFEALLWLFFNQDRKTKTFGGKFYQES